MHAQQPRVGLPYADPRPGQRPDGLSLFYPAGDDTGAPPRLLLVCRPPPVLIQQPRWPAARGDDAAAAAGRLLHRPHDGQDLADVLREAPAPQPSPDRGR